MKRSKLNKQIRTCLVCSKQFSFNASPSRVGRGKTCSLGCRAEHHRTIRGYKLSPETRRKYAAAQYRRVAAGKHPFWKGGITQANLNIRASLDYRLWREAVFKRDDFTCQQCGQWGGRLNADHIKPFARYPELRFDVGNGRTLCVPCHRLTDTYAGKARRYEADAVAA